jgi:UDP-3-O-acyl N-acetylglucosamine deacetylase
MQRTIAAPAEVSGVGFVTGKTIQLRFTPAPASTGVVFVRTDLGADARIAAHVSQVTGVERRTTLGQAPRCVSLVEHVLAALAGLKIDNCFVELNGPEPPGLDGSAKGFAEALVDAGIVVQPAKKQIWAVTEPAGVTRDGASLTLYPSSSPKLRVSYLLDYGPQSPIQRQAYSADITPDVFLHDIAPCRTFVTQDEALQLRQQGLGANTKVDDLVVFGRRGPIGNTLRCADEPARHKALDLIGDLALTGMEFCGHLVAYRSGHALNVELALALCERLTSLSLAA